MVEPPKKKMGNVDGKFDQKNIKDRIEALFLRNLGKVVTREMILKVAADPQTGKVPENWHQRLSELRTDRGYTILSYRDRSWLKISEYMMPTADRQSRAATRTIVSDAAWSAVLKRANNRCEWDEGSSMCGLQDGDLDPVGGGKVKLTPDHMTPHSMQSRPDPDDPAQWRALCGRHQVVKKNYWDNRTGKLNIVAIMQAAPLSDKKAAYEFLKEYFREG